MHDADFVERCARQFESHTPELRRHVLGLFKDPHILPGMVTLAEAPVIGWRYLVDQPHLVIILMAQVCAALCARERFRVDAPGYPPLPLREEEIETLKDDGNPRHQLVGFYGDSQAAGFWDLQHPFFAPFVSGLLAYRATPAKVRNDRELRREFPPRKLAGLCDGRLDWRSPERIAEDRQLSAWTHEMRTRREEGTARMQPFDEWTRTQLPVYCGCC
jgi:hypothetical protein